MHIIYIPYTAPDIYDIYTLYTAQYSIYKYTQCILLRDTTLFFLPTDKRFRKLGKFKIKRGYWEIWHRRRSLPEPWCQG